MEFRRRSWRRPCSVALDAGQEFVRTLQAFNRLGRLLSSLIWLREIPSCSRLALSRLSPQDGKNGQDLHEPQAEQDFGNRGPSPVKPHPPKWLRRPDPVCFCLLLEFRISSLQSHRVREESASRKITTDYPPSPRQESRWAVLKTAPLVLHAEMDITGENVHPRGRRSAASLVCLA